MVTEERVLEISFRVYYSLYLSASLFGNILFLYVVIYHSPTSLSSFKRKFVNLTILEIVVAWFAASNQLRVMTTSRLFVVVSYALGEYLGAAYTYFSNNLIQTANCCIALCVLEFMFSRYETLIQRSFLTSFRLPFIYIVCFIFMANTHFLPKEHGNCLPDEMIPYYRNSTVVCSFSLTALYNTSTLYRAATLFLSIVALGVPVLCFVLRILIKRRIRVSAFHMSETTRKQYSIVAKTLFFQSCIPFLSYVPVMGWYVLTMFSVQISLMEFLSVALAVLPSLVDPYLSIWLILPYRNAILMTLFKKQSSPIVPIG